MQLRDYQIDVVDRAREELKRMRPCDPLIIQAACGAGKTIIAIHLSSLAVNKGRRVLFVARGRDLVRQVRRFFDIEGIDTGVLMSKEGRNPSAPVQIASKDSLASWISRYDFEPPDAELILIDECHNTGASWDRIIWHTKYRESTRIGLSATPALANGKPLPGYRSMVQCIPRDRLIQMGHLVPCRVIAPYRPNLSHVPVYGAEYSITHLAKVMNDGCIVSNIVEWWQRLGENRPTVAYCCTKDHALSLCREFQAAGISAALLHGDTPDEEREPLYEGFQQGAIQVICNVAVMKEGIDVPWASCCINARPAKSVVFFWQMIGRFSRPWNDKKDALILDFAGASWIHGHPDFEPRWSIDPNSTVQKRIQQDRDEGTLPDTVICHVCKHVYFWQPQCPNCGNDTRYRKKKKLPKKKDAMMMELEGSITNEAREIEKKSYWKTAVYIAKAKHGRVAMARAIYYSRYHSFPLTSYHPVFPDNWGGMPVEEALRKVGG